MGFERNIVIFDPHTLYSDFTRMLTDKQSEFQSALTTRRCSARALEEKTSLIWELAGDARCDLLTQPVSYEEQR